MRFAPSESRVPPGLVNAPVSLLEAIDGIGWSIESSILWVDRQRFRFGRWIPFKMFKSCENFCSASLRQEKFLVYELLSGGDLHYYLERSRFGKENWELQSRCYVSYFCCIVQSKSGKKRSHLSRHSNSARAAMPAFGTNFLREAVVLTGILGGSPQNSSVWRIKGPAVHGEPDAENLSSGYQAFEHCV